MTSRQLIDGWVFSRLNGMAGYTGKVARVVPALLLGVEYPLITYQYQNFRDIEYGNGKKYVSEAVVLVKVWDKDVGFGNIDLAIDSFDGVLLSEAGKSYEGYHIEYVERESLSDGVDSVDGHFYCVGNYLFRVGIRCL